jgi:hypothetical protein
MNSCWANSIGGCSSKISGEHVVSKSIFVDNKLTISGVPWLSGETKVLPKSVLEAKVLCTTHNSALSKLDTAAMELSDALRQLIAPEDQKLSITIDGWLIERWCVKLGAGLMASGWSNGGKVKIPIELVEIAFGSKQFTNQMGLYVVTNHSGIDPNTDHIQWNILLDSSNGSDVCGIIITFRDLIFILFTRAGNPERLIQSLGRSEFYDFTNVKLTYRPKNFQVTVHHEESNTDSELDITFEW